MPKSTDKSRMPDAPGTNPETQRASERATTNKHPERDSNQADLSQRTSGSAHSMSTSHGGADRTIRSVDTGNSDWRWKTGNDTEDEVMRRVEEHSRDDHAGMTDWSKAPRNRNRDNIRHRKAA